MSELDRFCEQVQYLAPQKFTDDFFNNDMSTHTQSSTRSVPYERIIPITLTGQPSTSVKTSTKDWNSRETSVIKRYVYDPETMTHKPYVIEFQKEGNAGEYGKTQNFGMVKSTHKVQETLINDVPQENQILKKRQLPSDENEIVYMHMRSTPPPDYSAEVLRQPSDHGEEGKATIKKRMMDAESQQKVLHPQHSKSPVQRQIAKRTSSGSEHSKSCGTLPQQQQSSKNRQIKQTEEVITRLDDGILSTRNAIQSSSSQRLNDQEYRNYMVTSEMKRSKSPILKRLLMKKKKRPHSTSSADIQRQLDYSFEQPRALETSIEQSFQSPLRNYGRLIRDDEVEEQLQDRTIHLSEESPTTAAISPQNFRTEKAGAGMKFVNERDQLIDVNQLSLEEGLTPHPYKTEPWAKNGRRDKVDTDRVHSMETGKKTHSRWDWVNCCFFLLAPIFVFFVIIAIIITLALLA
ncbi:hypothetical protein X798_04878 [Onchocerca flexuosa]|uniref:Uncharacterized protein n=1 Tax=Onchocerca flexuosa TaxID=387005 RepID=A0A238BRV8_9BILA|nr:hypothetical protein X798_04878 [Onchocerca flexuosa]